MDYSNIKLKIDGVELPAPISMDYSLEDIDEGSERDVKNAILDRNRVRANAYKISLSYGINDIETVSKVVNMISPETFEVEIFDILTLERKTITMYAGSKSFGYMVYNGAWIKALKFNLVEV